MEHDKIFRGLSKMLETISWPISICQKYLMTPTKIFQPPSYILNVWSLISVDVSVLQCDHQNRTLIIY